MPRIGADFPLGHNNRGFLAVVQPEITRNRGIVLVGTAYPTAPVVELAPCDLQPSDQEKYRKASLAGPVPDELDNQVAGRLGEPTFRSKLPKLFF